jgi:ADP-ribose pyrophosphatase YjhB (NUDIX family)
MTSEVVPPRGDESEVVPPQDDSQVAWMTMKPLLLRIWRDVPFPNWMRHAFLRVLNPSFMVGAMALIQDEHGRILVLEHTYRQAIPWGLPGGWLKHAESPEAGLVREVFEETGLRISVDALLGADFWGRGQLDLLYRCSIDSGTFTPSDETASHQWLAPSELPELLPNQFALLRKTGLVR